MDLGSVPLRGFLSHATTLTQTSEALGFAAHHPRSFIPCGFNSVKSYVQERLISILCPTNSQVPPHRVEEGPGWGSSGGRGRRI